VYAAERHANRSNPQWAANVQKTYVARLNGTQSAPPRTISGASQIASASRSTGQIRSMSQLQQSGMKFEKVSAPQMQKQMQVSRQMTTQSQQMFRASSQTRISTNSVPRIGSNGSFHGGSANAMRFSNTGSAGNFRPQSGASPNFSRGAANPSSGAYRPQGNFQGFQGHQGQIQARPIGNMPSFGGRSMGGFGGGFGGSFGGGHSGGGHSASGGRH
jgi:hypothetical protein